MSRERIGGLTATRVEPVGHPKPVPMLFVHGLWADGSVFERWLPVAAGRGWDAWALDLRGRGASRPDTDVGKATMRDFAADVTAALDRLGDVVLIGHSMGSLVAQMVGPDPRIRALVLMCPIPPRGIVSLSGPVLRASWRYLPRMAAGRPFRPRREDQERIIMNRLAPEDRDRWFASSVPDSGAAARQIAIGAVKVDAGAVVAPTLVVSASDDQISPRALQPKMVRRYGAAHLAFDGHAHLITLEPGWERPAAAVLDWAERVVSP